MNIAVVGAGVSGLTTAIVLREAGHAVTIYTSPSAHMASPAAGAVWFLYDVEGAEAWALRTYARLSELVNVAGSGVSMIELRVYDLPDVPSWTSSCDFRGIDDGIDAGFAVTVPLMDTPVYLRYLRTRFGGTIREVEPFATLADVPPEHEMIVNCSGSGARTFAGDARVHPHRGQVALTAPQSSLTYGYVRESDLTYVLPRSGDCVLGGTNDVSDDVAPSEGTTEDIRRRCANVIPEGIPTTGVKVGLRPFREGGVRLEADRASDGRPVIHNYGHGGSGFTLSWGCAEAVAELMRPQA